MSDTKVNMHHSTLLDTLLLKVIFKTDFHKIEHILFCESLLKTINFKKWTVHIESFSES